MDYEPGGQTGRHSCKLRTLNQCGMIDFRRHTYSNISVRPGRILLIRSLLHGRAEGDSH